MSIAISLDEYASGSKVLYLEDPHGSLTLGDLTYGGPDCCFVATDALAPKVVFTLWLSPRRQELVAPLG